EDPSDHRPEVGFEGPGEGGAEAPPAPAPTCQKKMVMFADSIGEEVVLPYEDACLSLIPQHLAQNRHFLMKLVDESRTRFDSTVFKKDKDWV
ncbi:unnamed protein product, partial [Amoebophrya sp. A120]